MPTRDRTSLCPKAAETLFSALLRGLIAEGRVPFPGSVVDCGAHLGTESCLYAAADPRRTVHAIDPSIGNIKAMRNSFGPDGRTPLANVQPMHGALGSEARELIVPQSKRRPGGQMTNIMQTLKAPTPRQRNWSNRTRVRVYTLDELFAGPWKGESLGLAHFDVEGGELDVLRGAQATIRRDLPVFTVELFVHHNASYTLELLSFIESLGYTSLLVDEVCGSRYDARNLVNLPRQRQRRFHSSPMLEFAFSVRRLFRVDPRNIFEHAYPCCAPGGACCSAETRASEMHDSWAGQHGAAGQDQQERCCSVATVGAWLARHNRTWSSGALEHWPGPDDRQVPWRRGRGAPMSPWLRDATWTGRLR
jgi:FkbM family methyltransferase